MLNNDERLSLGRAGKGNRLITTITPTNPHASSDSTTAMLYADEDLSAYAGTDGTSTPYKIIILDSSAKTATAYLGSVGGGLTLGSELISNAGFETAGGGGADVFANWTEHADDGAIDDEGAIVHGGSHAAKFTCGPATKLTRIDQQQTHNAGGLYKASFYTRGDGVNAGRYGIYSFSLPGYLISPKSTGVSGTNYTQIDQIYNTQGGTLLSPALWCPPVSGGISYFDDVSVKQITDCAATGLHIYTTRGGSTRGWTADSGFDWNDIQTINIYR